MMHPYIHICICITPGSNIENDRIAKDLAVAERIWHPISFQIKDVLILDESFTFHNGEISYVDSIQEQPKVSSFFNTCSSQVPDCDIYICYIGSDYFKEHSVIACAYSFASKQNITGYIILTNAASPLKNIYTLAHEIGHILFTRRIQGKLTHADPHSPTGSGHHPSPTNLMYPIIPRLGRVDIKTLLTEEQRDLSLKSPLLRNKNSN